MSTCVYKYEYVCIDVYAYNLCTHDVLVYLCKCIRTCFLQLVLSQGGVAPVLVIRSPRALRDEPIDKRIVV